MLASFLLLLATSVHVLPEGGRHLATTTGEKAKRSTDTPALHHWTARMWDKYVPVTCSESTPDTPRTVMLTWACLKMCMMKMVRPRPKM